MAYDEHLADRVARVLKNKGTPYEEKKMMGGLCFMVDDKMCVGITNDELMARIDPEIYDESLMKEGCKKMMFTGREMKGFVWIDAVAIVEDKDLEYWVQLCLDFNPKAKSSKKRNKKKK